MTAGPGPAATGKSQGTDHAGSVERTAGLLLRYGVIVAAIIIGTGLLLALFRHGAAPRHVLPVPRSLGEVVQGLAELEPVAVIDLGLGLLILTPVLRVVASLVAFALDRDRTYTVIAAAILLILGVGFALGAAE